MRVSPLLPLPALFLLLAGCQGFPFFTRASASPSGAPESTRTVDGAFTRARLEMQEIVYDGETLQGRLLISPVGAELRIDKRLVESIALTVDSVVACDTGEAVPYVILDVLAPPLQERDILILKPGFWYGKEIHLLLFAQQATRQPSPRCFEAELEYHTLDVKNAARVHIRAERAAPLTPADGAGMPRG
jgi:hypothetical protein